MDEQTLTIYHDVTKSLIFSEQHDESGPDTGKASFSLAIGTANNLYKLLASTGGLEHDINSSIITSWNACTKNCLYAINDILKRYWASPEEPTDQALNIKVSLYENNELGQKLIYLIEQFDLVIRIIFHHAGNMFTEEQSAKWLIYFSDKLHDVLTFPFKSEHLVSDSLTKRRRA